jgi:hypothetical protein
MARRCCRSQVSVTCESVCSLAHAINAVSGVADRDHEETGGDFLCPPCYADVGGQVQLIECVEAREATAVHVIKLWM